MNYERDCSSRNRTLTEQLAEFKNDYLKSNHKKVL